MERDGGATEPDLNDLTLRLFPVEGIVGVHSSTLAAQDRAALASRTPAVVRTPEGSTLSVAWLSLWDE